MYELKVENDLEIPHTQSNHKLNKLINGKIRRQRQKQPQLAASCEGVLWPQELFMLERTQLYKRCNSDDKQSILRRCNEALMNDFYFLEKSGLAYCAKMILLADSTEVRQLYALMASDEATHLAWFAPYVKESQRTQPQSKLLPTLGKIIEECDVNSLYYLVQTIIEGWGFITYQSLVPYCQQPELQTLLKTILRDEALHHKAGLVLFDPNKIGEASQRFIGERLHAYAEILREGQHSIVQSFEHVLGELNLSELTLLFSQLKTERVAKMKLTVFKTLMAQPGMTAYIQKLEENGYDEPYSAEKAAKIYQESR